MVLEDEGGKEKRGRKSGGKGLYDLTAFFLFLGWCFGEGRNNSLTSTLLSQPSTPHLNPVRRDRVLKSSKW